MIYIGEGKTATIAKEKALEEAIACEKEVFIRIEEIEGSLLKKTKYKAYVITKQEIKEILTAYINDLAKYMNIKIMSTIDEEDSIYKIFLDSDNNSILIGKDGRTLNSIQTLLRQSLNKYGNFGFRVNIDISNYKVKKEKHLSFEIKKICKDVLKTKMDVKLDPMNSYERRIVHNVVSKFLLFSLTK